MKRFLKNLSVIICLFFTLVSFGYNFQLQPSKPQPKPKPPISPPPLLPPSIKTDLKWDLVKYEGPYSREAIIRITAKFTNIGGRTATCPDNPCRAVLRRITDTGSVEVWGDRIINTLSKGQSITLIKDYRVSCNREFTSIFEAFHEINCPNPTYQICVDPDYQPPQNTKNIYDNDLNDNYKRIDEKDIMNTLWVDGCKPRY